MDLNVAVIAGRLSTAPQLRNGGHEATLHLVCQRPAHPGQRPAAVDLVDVLVDTALATHVADFLVEGCRLIVGGHLESLCWCAEFGEQIGRWRSHDPIERTLLAFQQRLCIPPALNELLATSRRDDAAGGPAGLFMPQADLRAPSP